MGTTPQVGFRPKTPQKLPGMRIDPPPSVPTASGAKPAATAAAAPPLDPPGDLVGSQGFRLTPVSGESVVPFHPNSGVVVLPTMIPPAAFSRSTTGASSVGMLSAKMRDPNPVRTPRVITRSLTENGTP